MGINGIWRAATETAASLLTFDTALRALEAIPVRLRHSSSDLVRFKLCFTLDAKMIRLFCYQSPFLLLTSLLFPSRPHVPEVEVVTYKRGETNDVMKRGSREVGRTALTLFDRGHGLAMEAH
jgi:hypothetical protein